MEHYSKGKNVEEPFDRDTIPIPDIPQDCLWMHVNGGSKMRNLLTLAMKGFKDDGAIVWSGSGLAIGKAISCAEIVKRNFKQVYQISKICSRKVEEHWDPKLDNLDPLVVIREVPTIHILLSRDPLNQNEPGYQPPGSRDVFWKSKPTAGAQQKRTGPYGRKSAGPRVTTQQFAALGLRTGGRRNKDRGDRPTKNATLTKAKPGRSQESP